MKLTIDSNNILCASETIEQGKIYSHSFQWLDISSHDKTIFVDHKKKIKTMQFKDIGSNMSVFYVTQRNKPLWNDPLTLDTSGALAALSLYKSYDEKNDKQYAFLYKYPSNNINILNTQLHMLGIGSKIHHTDKWLIVTSEHIQQYSSSDTNDIQAMMSYLFVLTLLYGKMDIKIDSLMSIKIHVHLFGAYMKEQQILDTMIYFLQNKWLFFQKSIIESNDGIIYQLSTQDYEVLTGFAQLYKSIAKIDKIPTFDKMLLSKQSLLSTITYLRESGEIDVDPAIMTRIKNNIVKIITK